MSKEIIVLNLRMKKYNKKIIRKVSGKKINIKFETPMILHYWLHIKFGATLEIKLLELWSNY